MATLNKNNRQYYNKNNNNNNSDDNNGKKTVKLLDDDMKNTQTTTTAPKGVVQKAASVSVTRSTTPAQGGNQVSSEQGRNEHTESDIPDTHVENQLPFQRQSLRLSNKFIIIPGEHSSPPTVAPFRQTVSSSALTSLNRRPVSLISTSSTSKLLPRLSANLNDVNIISDVSWPSSKDINDTKAMSTDVTYQTLDESQSNLSNIKKVSNDNTKNNYQIRQSANFTSIDSDTSRVKMSTDTDKTINPLPQPTATVAKGIIQPSDAMSNQVYSDATSVRSLASFGIGSTDGRRLVIKRVPTTPIELFSLVHPDSLGPVKNIDDEEESFMEMLDEDTLKPRQQKWENKLQFVLACIGYSVGLGNVWRFPYMCYKSGGGVFLVPYCIIIVVCSIPLLYLELAVGQYTGRGPIGALGQLCPLFKGAGLASVVVSFLMSTYYSVIIAYSIYYFFTSFRSDLPWVDCNNRWNTPDCWVPVGREENLTSPANSRTPSEEFFENKVLQISPGIEFPGMMRWELFVCLIAAWVLVYFATWKSIKSSAKVRYFTATFPFVLILIFLGRAVTLDGAVDGLRYFFRPNWAELKNANVWINAVSQNFNSLGISFGTMISFASYNKYNNNILRDTVAVTSVNLITSLLVGIFAFATLGNLALEQNTHVKDVIGDGPGLIFVVYPQAMSKMPYTQLWAVMFFFMLLCLGLNTQFAIVEVVVTSMQDGFPRWIKRNLGYHEIVVLLLCCVAFLFGLPNIIQSGIYFFQLMDHYTASISIVFLAFCQLIAIAWLYGVGRLSKNIKQMTGKLPSLYFLSCWVFFGPCLLFAVWILGLINYHEPNYHNGRYQYPTWAYAIGWIFASLSLFCIPGYALVNLYRAEGNSYWEKFLNTLRPNIYECKICGEHHCEHDFPEQEQFLLEQEMSNLYTHNKLNYYDYPQNSKLGTDRSRFEKRHLNEKLTEANAEAEAEVEEKSEA